jgi:hypothetical protein
VSCHEDIANCVPLLQKPSWMPVDEMARAVIELSDLSASDKHDTPVSLPATTDNNPDLVYQVQNRLTFDWTADLLPALHRAGLEFQTVPQREWVRLLRESDPDPVKNPTVKLLDFFAEKYDNDRPGRSGLVFETRKTEGKSGAMRDGFDVVGSGLVERMVGWWRTQW